MQRLTEEENIAVVAITHDTQLEEFSDRAVNLVDGVLHT